MGFGSFFEHLVAPVIKPLAPAIKSPLAQALFPPLAVVSYVSGTGAFGFGAKKPANSQGVQTIHQSGVPIYQPVQQPTYPVPYATGGGGFDFGYQPAVSPYGGPTWGSSMTYSTPLIQPSTIYSVAAPQPADRSWEDLIAGALPFFL